MNIRYIFLSSKNYINTLCTFKTYTYYFKKLYKSVCLQRIYVIRLSAGKLLVSKV